MKEKRKNRADKLSLLVISIGLADLFGQKYFKEVNYGTQNSGVSFGLFKNIEVTLLVLLWTGITVILLDQMRKKKSVLPLLLITVGGGVNLVGRILWGGVWDYLHAPVINLWFNVSDVMITLGVILFIIPEKHED